MAKTQDRMYQRLGGRIRELRLDAALTQQQLGEASGLSAKYISEVERGRRNPTFSTLARVAHHGLKTSLSMLLLGIDDDTLAGRASRARDEARADSASALLGGRRPAERERLLAVFEQIVDLVDERVNVPAAARRRRAKRSDD